MSFRYIPPDIPAYPSEALQTVHKLKEAMTFVPPAKHKSWCNLQLPPSWRRSPKVCNCTHNPFAKVLRKVRTRAALEHYRQMEQMSMMMEESDG